ESVAVTHQLRSVRCPSLHGARRFLRDSIPRLGSNPFQRRGRPTICQRTLDFLYVYLRGRIAGKDPEGDATRRSDCLLFEFHGFFACAGREERGRVFVPSISREALLPAFQLTIQEVSQASDSSHPSSRTLRPTSAITNQSFANDRIGVKRIGVTPGATPLS